MSACLSSLPLNGEFTVWLVSSHLPPARSFLDLHCQGILPQDRVLSQQHPHLPSDCAPKGGWICCLLAHTLSLLTARSMTHSHTSWLIKTCSLAVCLSVQMPIFFFFSSHHHSMITRVILPLHLDPFHPEIWTQHTMFACFFFFFLFSFFKIHPYTNIDVLFSNPHWETWQCVIFLSVFCFFLFFFLCFHLFFCSFSSSRTDYVHTDVICHWQTQWDADIERRTRCERETEKIKIKKKPQKLKDRCWEDGNVMEKEKK